jgi:ribose transport system permease protein
MRWRIFKRVDPAGLAAFGCILLLLFGGSLYSSNFLSVEYCSSCRSHPSSA